MEIEELVPQLRTTDLERAIRFYTEQLGFALSFRYQDFYAGVRCGDRMIHLKLVEDSDPSIDFVRSGQHLHIHFAVRDIKAAFRQVQEASVKIVEGVSNRPWGTTEFVIEDPDGHTLYFGTASADTPRQ
ncbi:MAG: VOC family protein [Gammaproteobacteria bacterium]|nr:VOC family protein [Gammaproteobacteria bacterium]